MNSSHRICKTYRSYRSYLGYFRRNSMVKDVLHSIAAVALFFLIQAMGLSYVRIGVGAAYLLKRSLGDFWRILLASLPLILLAWLILYLFSGSDAARSEATAWTWGSVA